MPVSRAACVIILSAVLGFVSSLSVTDVKEQVNIQTKHVLEKDNLLLVCNTTDQPDIEDYYWIRNNTARATSVFYQSGWKVEFIDIRRASSGLYTCHAFNNRTGENVTLVAFKVDVQYPGEIDRFSLGPQVITENETFSVSCSFHGNPEPEWSIMNNDTGKALFKATASAGVTLNGNPVVCGDSGMWVCTGANRLNKGVNATEGFHIQVTCPPRPDPQYTPIYEYKSSLRSNISMALNITGDPVPEYKWSRGDGKTLGHVIVQNGARGTRLTLLDVDVDDFGNYTLQMTNSIGTTTSHFQLKAYGYPVKPHGFSASQISYNSVDLTWISGFDSGTKQRFQIMKYKGNVFESITPMISGPYENGGVGQEWSYHLTGLKSDTQYKLSVLAENADNFTFSDPIIFNTTSKPRPASSASTGFPATIVACVSVGVLVAIALAIILVVNYAYTRSRAYRIEDKRNLARDMKTEYGGTFALGVDTNVQKYPNTEAKF